MKILQKAWKIPFACVGSLILGAALCEQAWGQPMQASAGYDYPSKPIRVIVPFPPGGGADAITRAVTQAVASENGWTFVIENRSGAGGSIGVGIAAKSEPDGYTLVMGQTGNLIISPLLYADQSYDTQRDLQPISLIAESPYIIVASAATPYRTMAEVLIAAKAAPGKLNIGSSGNGTLGHIFVMLLQGISGAQLQYVPYRGVAQALVDVMAGTVELYAAGIPNVKGLIEQGKLRLLAVAARERFADLPDVPTLVESGLAGAEADSFHGLLAPQGTPDAVIAKLGTAFVRALQRPDLVRRLTDEGAVVVASTPEQFARRIRDDAARWGGVIRSTGFRLD